MEQEKVVRLLETYRGNIGRCGYIQARIFELSRYIRKARACTAEDLAGPSASIPGSTRSGNTESRTERAGIRLADGYVSQHVQDMEREATRLQDEYETKQGAIDCVNAWIRGLGKKDAWIIKRTFFDGLKLAEIENLCVAEIGVSCSKYVLRRMRNDALAKICEMAR